jgi:hypothetical protein
VYAYLWFFNVGFAKTFLGKYEEALPWLTKSIGANRNNPHLGRLDEARHEVEAGLAVDPKFTIKRLRANIESDNATYLAQHKRVSEGMRKAGVPEE